MKTMSPLLLILMLAGCANAYKDAYVPVQGVTPETIAAHRKGAAPAEPVVARGERADLAVLVQELTKRGYQGIGQANFTSSRQVPEFEAIEQGKRVGADLVLLLDPSFAGSTVTAVLKYATGNPRAPSFASADATCGSESCFGNGSTRDTYVPKYDYVAVPLDHSRYGAVYFALAR